MDAGEISRVRIFLMMNLRRLLRQFKSSPLAYIGESKMVTASARGVFSMVADYSRATGFSAARAEVGDVIAIKGSCDD